MSINESSKITKRQFIIDTDIHNNFAKKEDILPYLARYWHKLWLSSGTGVGSPYYSTVGVSRRDANPPSGGGAGSDPAFIGTDHLDRYGIDFGILTGGILSISLNPDCDYGNAVASAYNDYLAEVWLKADSRFKGSIVVNHSDPVAAAKEIERVGSHPDFVQVVMGSGSEKLFGQRFYHPIYEAAEGLGLPVAIHPGTEGRGISGPPTPSGYPTRYMEWHNILPINYMAHINSLVCEGVFEKYPKLKFIGIEGGIAWLAHLMWRMDKNYKALRDTVPWLKRRPSEYIREHIRLTTQPIEEPDDPKHLVQLIDMLKAEDMIMFASDYPHWDFDNPKMVLAHFPKPMRSKVFAGNAAKLYGLQS